MAHHFRPTPDDALRLFHTVRHLKPVQIFSRAAARVSRARPDGSPAACRRPTAGAWVPPAERPPSLIGRWRVRFLSEDGEIARADQWNDPSKAKLWLYNLHYFDDLTAGGAAARRAIHRDLVARWIAENPPGLGNGWEPYPVSLRIVNWIKWALAGAALESGWRDSLAMQVRWLERHIEWHLLGNHLLANAKALVFAGLFFDGDEGGRWLSRGLSIYARELPEQVLADGAHFELSPMYHAIMLEDLLDVLNAARAFGKAGTGVVCDLTEITARMRRWLAAMTHPDGGPSFFNDAAFGIAASRAELEDYAARLELEKVPVPGEGVHHLPASGYVRVNRGDMAAILDIAAIGPDYIPGHAHADTLSFELSLGRERIIVNGGTSTYAPGPLREAQRATAMHSTVEVDGENSSEVWASFRVARRARVRDVRIDKGATGMVVSASHDGYRRLSGKLVCRRTWRFDERALTTTDEIACALPKPAIARFHLGPELAAEIDASGCGGRFLTKGSRVVRWTVSSVARLEQVAWHPEFGKSIPNTALTAPLDERRLTSRFDWT